MDTLVINKPAANNSQIEKFGKLANEIGYKRFSLENGKTYEYSEDGLFEIESKFFDLHPRRTRIYIKKNG